MRISWMWMLVFWAMVALASPRAMADQVGQTSQLGGAVGSAGHTKVFKLTPATDAKLKPGDYVNIYSLEQEKSLLSDGSLVRDVWTAYPVFKNVKIIAIDRSEPLDPSALYANRMVRFEFANNAKHPFGSFSPYWLEEINLVIGLAGSPTPNICGDCDVLSSAEYRAKYETQCSIKTRSGSQITKVIMPCLKD